MIYYCLVLLAWNTHLLLFSIKHQHWWWYRLLLWLTRMAKKIYDWTACLLGNISKANCEILEVVTAYSQDVSWLVWLGILTRLGPQTKTLRLDHLIQKEEKGFGIMSLLTYCFHLWNSLHSFQLVFIHVFVFWLARRDCTLLQWLPLERKSSVWRQDAVLLMGGGNKKV